ncbi:hypothetical protein RJ640_028775 [Escallonia rubra]|uniref:Prostaglandin E synthase 2 n=1 Tax=Escallonia rubra TaxID=112253 RepID=A0AA88UL77_9ASTE|nr:hypothetical protein RJ640_028775 [Escallonia rubra]
MMRWEGGRGGGCGEATKEVEFIWVQPSESIKGIWGDLVRFHCCICPDPVCSFGKVELCREFNRLFNNGSGQVTDLWSACIFSLGFCLKFYFQKEDWKIEDWKGNFSYSEKFTVKYVGAAAMYFVSKKLKKKYDISDERAALYEAAETWVNALDGRDFLGGTKPNLADLAVFGVLRPIRYLRSGKDMVEHTRIGEWYERMETVVGESSRIKA